MIEKDPYRWLLCWTPGVSDILQGYEAIRRFKKQLLSHWAYLATFEMAAILQNMLAGGLLSTARQTYPRFGSEDFQERFLARRLKFTRMLDVYFWVWDGLSTYLRYFWTGTPCEIKWRWWMWIFCRVLISETAWQGVPIGQSAGAIYCQSAVLGTAERDLLGLRPMMKLSEWLKNVGCLNGMVTCANPLAWKINENDGKLRPVNLWADFPITDLKLRLCPMRQWCTQGRKF